MKPQASNLEPFVEIFGVTSPHADTYRFGYRLDGAVVSAVDLPAEIVEKVLALKARLSVYITPSGEIIPELAFASLVGEVPCAERADPTIDDLMRKTLNLEMLRMEEATSADLALLLDRLQRSASLVKDMLEQIARSSPNT
ncbi:MULTISPECIES: hypothetical protein [unclassified Bradyrhizobium]|uniref:hypothetical protein n=1 Tax=unclassified Bradyrhizobium TaxID=2631580 RepID=UPI00291619EF|nr:MULTISPECIES: hypothetical protein [unclassified Bradyrhizobium]